MYLLARVPPLWLPLAFAAAFFVKLSSGISLRRSGRDDVVLDDPISVLQGCDGNKSGVECLKRYVEYDDGAFSWQRVGKPERGTIRDKGFTRHIVVLNSQSWLAKETGRHHWVHALKVFMPDVRASSRTDLAVLVVDNDDSVAKEIAVRTGIMAVSMSDVPNIHMSMTINGTFREDVQEDWMKAISWVQYAKHPDHPEWPIEMPNTKAVVRAMDAITAFSKVPTPAAAMAHRLGMHSLARSIELPLISRFVLTGVSKRGMVTFHAAAVDNRVAGIIPVVMGLNLAQVGNWTMENLNGTANANRMFEKEGTSKQSTEDQIRVGHIIDPNYFIETLTVPKLCMYAGGDEYAPLEVASAYWSDLPAPKMLYMYGNAHHEGYLAGTNDFIGAADAFINALVMNTSRPEITWTIDNSTGNITVKQVSDHTPTSVVVWSSQTRDGVLRDFRGTSWSSNTLSSLPDGDGRRWMAHMPQEKGVWRAFFVTFTYEGPKGPEGEPWRMSTEVSVIPNTHPFNETLANSSNIV